MGIKDTGDYLTARGANPMTGLISPSVAAQTPRTPMTPGEALRLYGHDFQQQTPTRANSRLLTQHVRHARQKYPLARWKQYDKGWLMETVTEAESPKMTSEDRFVIPMPSGREPQPYKNPEHTHAQLAALNVYKQKAQRLSQLSQSNSATGLNGRMHSVGAGPRKFVEASKKLRSHALGDATSNSTQVQDAKSIPLQTAELVAPPEQPIPVAPTLSKPQWSMSVRSADSVMTIVKDMPGAYSTKKEYFQTKTRKSVGSPSLKHERKSSVSSVATTVTPTNEDQVPQQSGSNANRFDDFRQLPRVRVVHPDGNVENIEHQQDDSTTHDVVTIPDTSTSSSSAINPRNSLISINTSIAPSTVSTKSELSFLEVQLMKVFACVISLPLQGSHIAWGLMVPQMPRSSLMRAVNTLTDETADPADRLNAAKTVLFTGIRVLGLLGLMVVLIRVGVAVGQVLGSLLWPVRVLFVVVRWMFSSPSPG